MSHLTLPVDGSRDHIQGPEDAPVTLVEYGDYECSYCGQAFGIVQSVQAQMGNQMRFIFRNFPLTEIHPHAGNAALAAEIAATEGKFWEMHDALYQHQRNLADRHLAEIATGIGLDGNELLAKVEAGETEERVQEDFMSGVRSGVNGTPTFFINGQRYDGSWDEESLLAAVGG